MKKIFLIIPLLIIVLNGCNKPVTICTQDAKQCPDGSWVGRTRPKCEFVCPNTTDNKDWKDYKNERYGFGLSLPVSFAAFKENGPHSGCKKCHLNPINEFVFAQEKTINPINAIRVEVYKNDLSWVLNELKSYIGFKIQETKNVSVNNIPGKYLTIKKDEYYSAQKIILVNANGYTYSFSIFNSDQNEMTNIADKVLGSLQFFKLTINFLQRGSIVDIDKLPLSFNYRDEWGENKLLTVELVFAENSQCIDSLTGNSFVCSQNYQKIMGYSDVLIEGRQIDQKVFIDRLFFSSGE